MPHRKKFRLATALFGLGLLLLLVILANPPDMLAETLKTGFSQRIVMTPMPDEQVLIAESPGQSAMFLRGQFAFLEEIGWEITKVYVADFGQTAVITEGRLQDGLVIKALVNNPNNPNFTNGILEMQMSIFSPAHDLPGQKAGKWYIHGDWKITDSNASPEVTQYRYGPHTFKGVINLELDYNPLTKENQSQFLSQPVQFAEPGETVQQPPQGALIGNTRFNEALQLSGNSLQFPTAAEIEGGQ